MTQATPLTSNDTAATTTMPTPIEAPDSIPLAPRLPEQEV